MQGHTTHHETFIVRLSADGDGAVWRSEIVHVQTGRSWRVAEIAEIAPTIAAILHDRWPGPSPPADDEPAGRA